MNSYILIKGIGSIGRRHVNNLILLGYTKLVLVSTNDSIASDFPSLQHARTLTEAFNKFPISHVIISSPTSHHIPDLQAVLNLGAKHIYLEKPVSHSLAQIKETEDLIKKNKALVIVGFDLHYDPGINRLREWINQGLIGRVLSANAFVGQHLKQWRPYEDYRKGMSASIAQGGGVLLDLVHEFDYLRWILGEPERVGSLTQHNQCMEIETEDLVDVLIRFKDQVNVSIHLDYHQRKLIRNCIFTGEHGSIYWDLAERQCKLINNEGETSIFDYQNFERNERYLAIMKNFIALHEDERLTTFTEGLTSLKMVQAAKESAKSQTFISLTNMN